jgi:nucleoid-associated protein YgaU
LNPEASYPAGIVKHGSSGYCPTPNTEVFMSEKMPDFSNVQSGSSSSAEKIYEVKAGDSLSKIAKREYGDANEWKRIFEANKDTLKDPNKIFPGQKLKIPAK